MTLPYLVSIVSGLLLGGLLAAFIFRRDFRRDCLAKEGQLQFLGLSVQGAVVLSLFAVFLVGPMYSLKSDSDGLNEQIDSLEEKRDELARKNTELIEQNKALVRRLNEKRVWKVRIPIKNPQDPSAGFDPRTGVFVVTPASVRPEPPECSAGSCVFTMNIETSGDAKFEDAIKLITYNNGIYYGQVVPGQVSQDRLLAPPTDGLRHYPALDLYDGSEGTPVYPRIF